MRRYEGGSWSCCRILRYAGTRFSCFSVWVRLFGVSVLVARGWVDVCLWAGWRRWRMC